VKTLSWFVERRLDYVDYRLVTAGFVNRSHLCETFGISEMQASTTLQLFLKKYPGAMVYDKRLKHYRVFGSVYHTRRRTFGVVIDAVRALAKIGHPLGWA
jgi:hypothetical protein